MWRVVRNGGRMDRVEYIIGLDSPKVPLQVRRPTMLGIEFLTRRRS
jgi:hypothetical protein